MRRFILSAGAMAVLAGMAMAADGPATWAAKLPFTVSPETTRIVSPLRADGTPDYIAALNDKYGKGVTPENNAFVAWTETFKTIAPKFPAKPAKEIYRLAGIKQAAAEGAGWESFWDFLEKKRGQNAEEVLAAMEADRLKSAGVKKWDPGNRADMEAFLDEQNPQLDVMVEISKKSRWWAPLVATKGHALLSVAFFDLGPVSGPAETLCVRAMRRMAQGNFEGFLEDELAVKRIARLVGQGPGTAEMAAASELDRLGSESIGYVAGSGALNEAQCKRISAELAKLGPLPEISDAVNEIERWQQLDIAESVATADVASLGANLSSIEPAGGETSGSLRALLIINPADVDWDAVLQVINDADDRTIEALRNKNFAAMSDRMRAIDSEIEKWGEGGFPLPRAGENKAAYSQRVGRVLVKILRPDFWRAEVVERWAVVEGGMLKASLAAAEWHAHTGKWPESLKQLVPEYLPAVPVDICAADGAAVRYVVREKGIEIYSVGQNGKDDGGVSDRKQKKDDIRLGVPE